jgi:hypothetical protein
MPPSLSPKQIRNDDRRLLAFRRLTLPSWDYSRHRKKIGRPPASFEVVEVVLRLGRENPTWGYDRIRGALVSLGHLVPNIRVGGIRKAHGVDPSPDRKRQPTSKSFLKAHWGVLASVDFTTIEVWTKNEFATVHPLWRRSSVYSMTALTLPLRIAAAKAA